VFSSTLINETLVGYNSVLFFSELNDWAGIGKANAQYGIPGDQAINGLSNIQVGRGASPPSAPWPRSRTARPRSTSSTRSYLAHRPSRAESSAASG